MSTVATELVSPATAGSGRISMAMPIQDGETSGLRPFAHRNVIALTLVGLVVVGIGDRITGVELPFTILYILPIAVGAWYIGRSYGIALSGLATVSVGWSLVHDHNSWLALAWNLVGAAALFIAASWAVARLRGYFEHERAMRRLAVDQLRHAERLNVIGTLAAGVAHELGTPLNVITGCAEFLAEDSADPQVQHRTGLILAQVAKVSSIIRHLLEFGHRGSSEHARIDLHGLAQSTAELLRSTAKKQHCEIEVEAGPPIFASGTARELEQVISNLILNGMQAMTRGTVRLRTSVKTRANQRVACITVEDQGCGIPAEDLSKIFDPFFTTKGVGQGTGLGLSVSYGIVRDHDGTIEVQSTPRRGTKFNVLLPLRD